MNVCGGYGGSRKKKKDFESNSKNLTVSRPVCPDCEDQLKKREATVLCLKIFLLEEEPKQRSNHNQTARLGN